MRTASATFGKFNIVHTGHVKLFSAMAEDAEVVIGISGSEKKNRNVYNRIKDIRAVFDCSSPYTTFICPNLYVFLISLASDYDRVALYLGSDRISTTQSLIDSLGLQDVITIRDVFRADYAPSSTKLREVFAKTTNLPDFEKIANDEHLVFGSWHSTICYKALLDENS